ncbi:enoyl-CoA hydratase-related protein [Aquisediminimonas profunda]|uniref:enoyl-CoA hydratase-related protein n=1 Tax=Aquisediminimonas profunda TaxID=1550733 RepID=UPI001C632B91|nr:enoyl-CoA hydratase-related protein [Aquisediminimonas profunda]
MNFEHIRIDHGESIDWIVLNRPDRANAMSNAMLDEFSVALELLKDEGAPVVGIRGEGKGFCSGFDLEQVGKMGDAAVDPVADRARLQRNLDRWMAIWDHPKPVIAAVHGYCLAGATQMCVFADITVVADDARIGEPTIPIGGGYLAPVWSTLVGPKRAKELAFVPGNAIDGPTAVEWGWANHCVPAADLIASVEGLAARIALTPPEVLRIKKLSINRAAEAQGFRLATAHVADMDALLHQAPAVQAVKRRGDEIGLKALIAEYRSAPTSPLKPYSRDKRD